MTSQIANVSLLQEWNVKSVETISLLQTRLLSYEWWIVQSSVFGDNKEAFAFFFPFIAGFQNILGIKVLWAAVFSEWLNLILKWLFKGERPYWWIHQNAEHLGSLPETLRQFPNTCESGPGTPSGHLMMNVAIFYVITKGISKNYIWASKKYQLTKLILSSLVYAFYIAWISLVFISRLYIQAHFIHQCVLGVLIGLVIGQITWSNKWLTKPHTFESTILANLLGGSAIITYWFLMSYGLDPLWAIPLAMKYCDNEEYVRIETQPYYIMVRFFAMALGLGFAVASKHRKVTLIANKSFMRTVLTVKIGILFGRLLSLMQNSIPKDDLMLYLSSNFALQLLYPYIIIILVPNFLHKLYPGNK